MARETNDGEGRDESGRYAEEYPTERFIDVLENSEGGATTTEVADEVGCDRRTAYVKLTTLRDDERASSRKVGQTLLWTLTETDGGTGVAAPDAASPSSIGPDRVIRAVRLTTPDSTPDRVADTLDVSRETARARLRDLADAGRLEAVTIADSAVYRVVD